MWALTEWGGVRRDQRQDRANTLGEGEWPVGVVTSNCIGCGLWVEKWNLVHAKWHMEMLWVTQ